MPNEDFCEAEQLERFGDEATASGQAAAPHYREAQRLLLPVGVVWTDRELYDRRLEAFERIQQKLYACDGRGHSGDASVPVPAPQPATSLPLNGDLPVWNFASGLIVRVAQTFRDYDDQEIQAGEILHFLDSSYFPYESGHTLRFAEKTIRLSGNVEEHVPIIANLGNAWFSALC